MTLSINSLKKMTEAIKLKYPEIYSLFVLLMEADNLIDKKTDSINDKMAEIQKNSSSAKILLDKILELLESHASQLKNLNSICIKLIDLEKEHFTVQKRIAQ